MKSRIFALRIALASVFALGALGLSLVAQAQTAKTKQNEPTTAKPAERPKYVIRVAHGGRPLGAVTVELFPDVAPKHVANFDSLVGVKFYNGTVFHRIISGFMIQGGDPNTKDKDKSKDTWGIGDPSQTKVPAEFSQLPHKRGVLAAARSAEPNSASSQFFICHADAQHLLGQYTVFGQVVAGLDIVDSIAAVKTEIDPLAGIPSRPVERVEMTVLRKSKYVISVKHGKKPLGNIVIETLPEVAPKHVANFDSLVALKFYDSTAFHRVIPNFMVQGGDPNSKDQPKNTWGMGNLTQRTVPAEFNSLSHTRGMVSAARTNEPDSHTSQFFVCHGNPTMLDRQYTIFAQTVSGIEVVDKIVAVPCETNGGGEMASPIEKVEMKIRRVELSFPKTAARTAGDSKKKDEELKKKAKAEQKAALQKRLASLKEGDRVEIKGVYNLLLVTAVKGNRVQVQFEDERTKWVTKNDILLVEDK